MRKLHASNPLLHRHGLNTVDQLGTAIPVGDFEQRIVDRIRSEADIDINHLSQLYGTDENYSEALPVLLDVLQDESYPGNIRAAVAGSLQRRFARDYVLEPVLNLYQNPNTEARLKDALANVLITLSQKKDLPKIFPLVLDNANADGRILLLQILKKFPSEDVRLVLKRLLDDPYPHVAANAKRILSLKSFSNLTHAPGA
jgi:hypothetical protein